MFRELHRTYALRTHGYINMINTINQYRNNYIRLLSSGSRPVVKRDRVKWYWPENPSNAILPYRVAPESSASRPRNSYNPVGHRHEVARVSVSTLKKYGGRNTVNAIAVRRLKWLGSKLFFSLNNDYVLKSPDICIIFYLEKILLEGVATAHLAYPMRTTMVIVSAVFTRSHRQSSYSLPYSLSRKWTERKPGVLIIKQSQRSNWYLYCTFCIGTYY